MGKLSDSIKITLAFAVIYMYGEQLFLQYDLHLKVYRRL